MYNGCVCQLDGSWGVVGLPQTPLALLPFLLGQFDDLYVKVRIIHEFYRWGPHKLVLFTSLVYIMSTPHRCCCPHPCCYCPLHHCPGTLSRHWRLLMLVPERVACSRTWVRSAKSAHCSPANRKRPLLLWGCPGMCSHFLLYFRRAGAALLLLPCSEHRWPPSHPGQAAGLPHLLFTLLPHKLD